MGCLVNSALQLVLSECDIVAENEAALVVGDMVGKLQAEASVADLAREPCGLSFGCVVLEVALRELVKELFVGLVVRPCRSGKPRNALIVLGSALEEGQNLVLEGRLCLYKSFEGVPVGENLLGVVSRHFVGKNACTFRFSESVFAVKFAVPSEYLFSGIAVNVLKSC